MKIFNCVIPLPTAILGLSGKIVVTGGLPVAWLLLVGSVIAGTATTETKTACNASDGPAVASQADSLQRFSKTKLEMAVSVTVTLYAHDPVTANTAAEAVFQRFAELNDILSDYDKNSELRRLCATAGSGRAISVSNDLWVVLSAAVSLARQSNGAFDPTIGPVVRQWRRARRRGVMPDAEKLAQCKKLVDYRLIKLDPKHKKVELTKPGMRIDLGGIAKGYALDEAMRVLRKHGITRALVDAGGDLVLGDPPPGKEGWTVGVARLKPGKTASRYLNLANVGIATSGDAWQHVEIGGRRYSHLVDPRTGVGLTDHSSVTVIAPDGMTADGLASALSVLGPKDGLKLIDTMPQTAAFIVRAPRDEVESYESRRWKCYPVVKGKDQGTMFKGQ